MQDEWVEVGPIADLAPGEMMRVDIEPPIAIYNIKGKLYATADTCTHEVAPLTEGFLDDDVVECAFHFAKFCVRTGEALTFPATEPLDRYDVDVRDGMIVVSKRPVPGGTGE
jgi:nitrite reductase/ring-hydroxylating ferredoxin subunit